MELHDSGGHPQVERSVVIEAPPATVWQHLVDGSLASLWMGGVMLVEAKLGGRVELNAQGAPVIFGTVEGIDPGSTICWTWRTREGEPTQVVIHLAGIGTQTTLTVTERLIPYEIVIIPPTIG
ncbi:MAG TPA: SRPBCC domain-containing protein [Acidimicrobiia bacterium]